MRLLPFRRAARIAAGAVFGLLVLGLGAPGKVQAGCVLGHGQPTVGSSYFERLLDTGGSAPGSESPSTPAPRVPGPCPGGFCTNGPAVPAPAPPPAPRIDQLACLLDDVRLQPLAAAGHVIEHLPAYSAPALASIDRPPRP